LNLEKVRSGAYLEDGGAGEGAVVFSDYPAEKNL
jgi:hypothetical protein